MDKHNFTGEVAKLNKNSNIVDFKDNFKNYNFGFGEENKTITKDLLYNRGDILRTLNENGLKLRFFSSNVKKDFQCIETAMRNNYLAYEYVDDSLKLDDRVVNIYWEEYIKSQEEIVKTRTI